MNKIKKVGLALMSAATSFSAMVNQVDLNKASKNELLKGITGLTEQQADAFIQYREKMAYS